MIFTESDQRVNSVQGLQMTEGVDTTNAAGVYTTTGRNSYANAGRYITVSQCVIH